MNENEFKRQQQAAVERMREMNARANMGGNRYNMPPVPPFVKVQRNEGINNRPVNPPLKENKPTVNNKPKSFLEELNIPFLDNLTKDGDLTLIIGLLLILMSEKADKRLIFALIYILM